jgi:Holliday junction resolvasome RuvABC ATP-dependent DNA helicase subunit
VGSKILANFVGEQEITVTGMIEPFLFSEIELQFGDAGSIRVQKSPFVRITKKGRIALEPAYNYIKLCHSLQKQGWFTNESLNTKPE